MRRISSTCVWVSLVMATAVPVSAQQDSRWRLGVSAGFAAPAAEETYEHRYVPSLSNHPESGGSGGQSLRLDADRGNAPSVSLAYRLNDRLGVELLATRWRSSLAGANSPYAVALHYEGRQPPDYVPRPMTYTDERAWPNTGGELRETALALNVAARVAGGNGISYEVTGGAVAYRLDGELESLGYTSFAEGGHGVLFPTFHSVGLELEPAWTEGLDLGGQVAARLSPWLEAVLAVRAFWGRDVDVDPRVKVVLNADELIAPLSPAELQERMALRPVRVDPSLVLVSAGLRFGF